MTFQDKQLYDLLSSPTIIEQLNNELAQVIDVNTLKYEVGFVPSYYFLVNKELKAAPYIPEQKYLIEGNEKSLENVIPSNVFQISPILRPRKQDLAKYMRVLNMVSIKKIFFKPFIYPDGSLSIFSMAEKGGVVINVADVKSYDDSRLVD